MHLAKGVSTKKTAFSHKQAQDGDIAGDLALLAAADNLDSRQYGISGGSSYQVLAEKKAAALRCFADENH